MVLPPTRLLFVWLFLLGPGCSSPGSPSLVEASGPGSSAAEVSLIVELTNVERSRAGVALFTASPPLMRAAQLHAEQMAALGRMAHVLPGATYPNPEDRLAAVGYQWQAYAENVAYGQASPASALSAWMNSSGHRANILNPGLTELGAGVAVDGSGRPYFVQVFGSRR